MQSCQDSGIHLFFDHLTCLMAKKMNEIAYEGTIQEKCALILVFRKRLYVCCYTLQIVWISWGGEGGLASYPFHSLPGSVPVSFGNPNIIYGALHRRGCAPLPHPPQGGPLVRLYLLCFPARFGPDRTLIVHQNLMGFMYIILPETRMGWAGEPGNSEIQH